LKVTVTGGLSERDRAEFLCRRALDEALGMCREASAAMALIDPRCPALSRRLRNMSKQTPDCPIYDPR
jgi:hypothetical protein